MADQVTGLYGNYLGVVVQNNDPEKKGRVKIFIPHLVSAPIARTQVATLNNGALVDRIFRNIDSPDLQEIVGDLKRTLPWAEPAGPLFGGNASGRYVAKRGVNTTSNNVDWDFKDEDEDRFIGNVRPAARYTNQGILHDGFNDEPSTGVFNPYSYQYTPSDYSSLAAGAFTIPNVGAHVWVFFQNGSYNLPVYWASSYGVSDFKRIYTTEKTTDFNQRRLANDKTRLDPTGGDKEDVSVDYPGIYENDQAIKEPGYYPDSYVFRAKHVINTNKHTFELIDTDDREIIKLTHFSGSFLEFNNNTTVSFAAHNEQKLVLGNQFETIRTNKNLLINENFRTITEGDCFLRVGDFYNSLKGQGGIDEIKQIIDEINQYRALFDMRRIGRNLYAARGTNQFDIANTQLPSSSKYGFTNEKLPGLPAISRLQDRQEVPDSDVAGEPMLGDQYYNGYAICPGCKNLAYEVQPSFWYMSQQVVGNTELGYMYAEAVNPLDTPLYLDLKDLESKQSVYQGLPGHGFNKGGYCDVCTSFYLADALRRGGYSPSTENGRWKIEERKQYGPKIDTEGDTIWSVYRSNRSKLNKLLNKCRGGDYIQEIHKNKIVTVGLIMNEALSYRVDPIGKLRAESMHVAPEGVYVSGKPSPLVELVDVAEVPGGNYTITAGNKLKFLVGAKGVNIKTFGPIDMYGTLCQFASEQMNISSQNEINLDAGERLLIRARKTIIVSRDHEPVLIESPLHVSRNMIVNGGAYIHGEVGLIHVTAPREYGFTSPPTYGGSSTILTNEEDPEEPVDGEPFEEPYEDIPPREFLWDYFYAGCGLEFLGQQLQAAGENTNVFGTETKDDIAGAILTLGGGVFQALCHYLNEKIYDDEIQDIKDALKDLRQSINDLQGLQADFANLLAFFKTHEHLYARIPTNFMNSAEAVRSYLQDDDFAETGINSRGVATASSPLLGSGGPYFEAVKSLFTEWWAEKSTGQLQTAYNQGRALAQAKYEGGGYAPFEYYVGGTLYTPFIVSDECSSTNPASITVISTSPDYGSQLTSISRENETQTLLVRCKVTMYIKRSRNFVQMEAAIQLPENAAQWNSSTNIKNRTAYNMLKGHGKTAITFFTQMRVNVTFKRYEESGKIPLNPTITQVLNANIDSLPGVPGFVWAGVGAILNFNTDDKLFQVVGSFTDGLDNGWDDYVNPDTNPVIPSPDDPDNPDPDDPEFDDVFPPANEDYEYTSP